MNSLLSKVPKSIYTILDKTLNDVIVNKPSRLSIEDAIQLLSCSKSADSVAAICLAANICREIAPCGDNVTYVVNRNINFTNACIKKCGFCAFSRTGIDEEAYFLPIDEILRRAQEAVSFGATEICVQAGLPPNMNPNLYTSIAKEIKALLPSIHLHAYSPEEIIYGAQRNKCSVRVMIQQLKDAGVDTFPGTSAEILVDSVRHRIAPGRLSSAEWIDVMSTAHSLSISTTATMMYGHVETVDQVASHLLQIRDIQRSSKDQYGVGFTEFVPLSFVAKESPLWKDHQLKLLLQQQRHYSGKKLDNITGDMSDSSLAVVRSGPTGNEVLLTHAVSRLAFAGGHIDNIQVSWVKEGFRMAQLLLSAGVNDLGGTLMNESISTSAGAAHGQLATPAELRALIDATGRVPVERTTDYSYRKVFYPMNSSSNNNNNSESYQQVSINSCSGNDDYAVEKNGITSTPPLQHEQQQQEHQHNLDGLLDSESVFGSYHNLIQQKSHRYKAFHKQQQQQNQQQQQLNKNQKRDFSSSSSSSLLRGNTTNKTNNNNYNKVITYSSSYTLVPTYECYNACTYCNFRVNVQHSEANTTLLMPISKVHDTLLNLKQHQQLQSNDENTRHHRNKNHHKSVDCNNEVSSIRFHDNKVDEILILSGEINPTSKRRSHWFNHIVHMCDVAIQHGFYPHTNIGPLSYTEMKVLKQVNASMGLMIEQTASRLNDTVHKRAKNKDWLLYRKEQLLQAIDLQIPFTTGVLIGIGETEEERLQSLTDIADVIANTTYNRNSHNYTSNDKSSGSRNSRNCIQEIILQPYSPGSRDKLAASLHSYPLSNINGDASTSAVVFDIQKQLPSLIQEARRIFPPSVAIQIPPNLVLRKKRRRQGEMSIRNGNGNHVNNFTHNNSNSDKSTYNLVDSDNDDDDDEWDWDWDLLLACLDAGASDLGGISPVDEVNQDWLFPSPRIIQRELKNQRGYELTRRLPVHDDFISLVPDKINQLIINSSN